MIQAKLEVVYFEMKNFFTPLESFVPSLCHDEILEYWRSSKSSFEHSNAKKGGKKLLHGVKNFSISKFEMSAFSWIKNDAFIWKIYSCTFLQSLSTSRVGYRVSPLKVAVCALLSYALTFWFQRQNMKCSQEQIP